MTLFLLSLIAGVLTVLAPCVLPLLPVIVGGSIAGGIDKTRALVITSALGISIILFTLLLKVSTAFIMVPEYVWQFISGGIIIVFGLILLFPQIWKKFSFANSLNQQSNALLAKGYQKKSFWGNILIGASLGPVFAACSPTFFVVLATVIPQSFALGLLDLLAYTFGLCISLLLIALLGQRVMDKLGVAADPHSYFKRTIGVLFLIVGVLIMTGIEKKIEVGLLNSGFMDITKVEQILLRLNNN